MTAGEVEMLLFALERSRAQFAWKCGGLDAAALRQPHPPSAMTMAGLIKHLALCEDARTAEFVTGEPMGAPWDGVEGMSVWEWCWRSAADDTPEELYALWRGAVERTRRAREGTRRRGSRPAGEVHHRFRRVTQPPAVAGRPARRVRPPCRPRRPVPRGRRRPGGGGPAARMMRAMHGPIPIEQVRIVPANEASWDDLVAIFGTADYASRCRCQRFKVPGWIWRDSTQEERTVDALCANCVRQPERRGHQRAGGLPRRRAGGLGRGRAAHGVPETADLCACRGAAATRTRTTTASGR